MHRHYDDILQATETEPLWFDEAAVPRFCDFSPSKLANIYADECALVRITCQSCKKPFLVAFSDSLGSRVMRQVGRGERELPASLAEEITAMTLHYGDPPNMRCCPAGPTMNSVPRRVLEYWRSEQAGAWQRNAELEIDIVPDWWDESDGPFSDTDEEWIEEWDQGAEPVTDTEEE